MSKNYYFLLRHSVLTVILLSIVGLASGQQNLNFTTLTTKNGLSSNSINGIIKDRFGLVWFATSDGLNRYDGSGLTIYRHQENDPSSFPANDINTIYEDREGRLWLGTAGSSLVLYDRTHDVFKPYSQNGFGEGRKNETVRAICEDYQGRLWVSTYAGLSIIDFKNHKTTFFPLSAMYPSPKGSTTALSLCEDKMHVMWIGTSSGLLRYNSSGKTFTRFIHDDKNKNTLNSDVVKSIIQDERGKLWFGTFNGLSQISDDGKSMIRVPLEAAGTQAANSTVYTMAVDNGDLWLGTEDGLIILNTHTHSTRVISPKLREMFGLSDKSVRSIMIDKNGIYWLGTFQGGVNKFDRNLPLFNHKVFDAFDDHGLKASTVTSFAQYDHQNVFVGTDNGGLQLFNIATGLFKSYPINAGKGSNDRVSILTMKYASDGRLWIGTFQKGLFILDPKSGAYEHVMAGEGKDHISGNDIFAIEEDQKGRMWIGMNGEGVDIYDPKTKQYTNYESLFNGQPKLLKLNNFIRCIVVGDNEDMWVGSSGGGVAVFHLSTGKISLYNQLNSKISSDLVSTILKDKRNQMWLGTNAGISVFDKDQKLISVFSEKDGLSNNVIHKILEDDRGIIWISTNKGINNFDPLTKKFNGFSHTNGVQDSPFASGSGIKLNNGMLFFGGLDGFNYFNPVNIPEVKNTPGVMLTELKVANNKVFPDRNAPIHEQIYLAKEIRLAYGQNFSISYTALNYTNADQDRYSFMLKGFDKEWNNVGKTTTAYYTNIDPGTYTFMVRASNGFGAWSLKPTTIIVKILPPWWRTVYAYLIYFLSIVGLLFYIRNRGIKKIRLQMRFEEEKREAQRMHELDLAKINFLTNLSHEFRTPISLIMAPADKLTNMQTDQKVAREVTMISRNARRLLNLVNQLLDFRKMEEQELRLNLSDGDVVEFIREAVNSFQDLSERKQVKLKYHSEVTGYFVMFDHDKIERIIFNLLSNAFKYTPAGGDINVNVSLISGTDDKQLLKVAIADSGIGIPADEQKKIFERFYQHDTSDAILNQGTGIGLSITKEFVELHGGQIEIESEPGKGAIFTLLFPFLANPVDQVKIEDAGIGAEQQYEEEIHEVAINDEQDLQTILIVEDNEDFRFYLKESLKGTFRILEAANGKEGWQKALSAHPDLVVTDISMPQMNGIELCKKIKGDKRTSFIPVILLTALTAEQDQLKGLETGANDYLNKPFNFNVLNAKVTNLIKLNKNLKNAFSKQIQLIQPEIHIESADEKLLNKVAQFVEDKLNDPEFSIEELSKNLAMSRSSLYNKIFELTGLAPVEYVRSIKLQKAAVLLAKSQYTIREIAFMTGFGTPGYFSKLFKAKYNMSPSEYLSIKRQESKIKMETVEH